MKKTTRLNRGSAGRASPAAVDAAAFGALLLDLYRLAREESMADFQRCVLERLSEVLSFDAAWWGMSALDRELHSSYPFRLPPRFVEVWSAVREHDVLADHVLAHPSVTLNLDRKSAPMSPENAAFMDEFRLRHTLCTVLMNPTLNLTTFLSLYRHDDRPYNESERRLKELVMPHLWAAWTSNWIAQLASAQAHSFSSAVSLAVADQKGVLHAAEPRFSALAHLEWPEWQGPELPAVLRGSTDSGEPYCGARTLVKRIPACGLVLIEMRELSPLDRLTPRELRIAEQFGTGRSYKEIAAGLRVSPATVRAHLRAIYAKLAISDKTELANLLSAHSNARQPSAYN